VVLENSKAVFGEVLQAVREAKCIGKRVFFSFFFGPAKKINNKIVMCSYTLY
jgi:hypothetical protein